MKNKIHLFFDELKEKYQTEPQSHHQICHKIKHQILTILNLPEEDIDFNFTIFNHIEETYKGMLETKENPPANKTQIENSKNETPQQSTESIFQKESAGPAREPRHFLRLYSDN